MAIKLNSEEQQQALASILTFGERRVEFFQRAASDLSNIEFSGGSRDALVDNFQNFEKATNSVAEIENQVADLIKKNIEISEQMMQAAYQRGKVENKTFSADIANKKGVTMADI